MSNRIKEAYQSVEPPEALIRSTLEQIKKRRIWRNIELSGGEEFMTIERVKAIAKEKYGKELTDAQAAAYAEKYGKLADDELDSVAGGCGGSDEYLSSRACPNCGANTMYNPPQQHQAAYHRCPNCGWNDASA